LIEVWILLIAKKKIERSALKRSNQKEGKKKKENLPKDCDRFLTANCNINNANRK
jgi:hypothetical protein